MGLSVPSDMQGWCGIQESAAPAACYIWFFIEVLLLVSSGLVQLPWLPCSSQWTQFVHGDAVILKLWLKTFLLCRFIKNIYEHLETTVQYQYE